MNRLNRAVLTVVMTLMLVATASAQVANSDDTSPSANSDDTSPSANSDDTPPSVTFESTPDSPTTESNPLIALSTNEDARVEYSVDDGFFTDLGGDFRQGFEFYTGELDGGDHTVEVRAEDEAGNTQTDSFSFKVDDAPPSVTFESTPDSPTTESNPTIGVNTNEDARVEYSVDGGAFTDVGAGFGQDLEFELSGLNNGDHTVEVRAEDEAGNTQTESFSFKVADGSEVDFQVAVDKSYPGSGVPIEPQSDVFGTDTTVDFEFSLEANGKSIDISNGIGDGTCDFRGNEQWVFQDNNYCGTEIPASIGTGEYELVAKWELGVQEDQDHERVIDGDFEISEIETWYEGGPVTSHGKKIKDGFPDPDTKIDGNSEMVEGNVYACKGSSYEIESIDSVVRQCSNGVINSAQDPPVVSFVRTPGQGGLVTNNNMFSSGSSNDCDIEVARQTLLNTRDEQAYYPGDDCGSEFDSLRAKNSFTAVEFGQTGQYEVFLDYVNAASDSPQYICPADPSSPLCDVGKLSGEPGWGNSKTQTVEVIEPSIEIDQSNFSQSSVKQNVVKQNVNGDTYIRRIDYNGSINGVFSIKNTGAGNIDITGLGFECPPGVNCETITSTDLKIAEGNTALINWKADVPDVRTTGTIKVTVQYEDSYGVGCPITGTPTRTYYLDEADPETDQGVN